MRRLNWRAALGIILGFLLALPLVWLLQLIATQRLGPNQPGMPEISPVLSFEERMNLSTYKRRCSSRAMCEPPLGCLPDMRYRTRVYCTDSECVTDAQCPEQQVCRVLATYHGPWVRRCVILGDRAEGERCYVLPYQRENGCRPGLVCAGQGWCSRPCSKDVPSACPEGFFCAELEPEPACLPTCAARGCPPGQECIRTEDGASTCAVVHGTHCQQTPCPLGQQCEAAVFVPKRPGEAWMSCVQECGDQGEPVCPAGYACFVGSCHRLCTPDQPGICGEGFTCIQLPADAPWLCRPEWFKPEE